MKKINAILLIFAGIILFLIFFAVSPFFSQIIKESQKIITQKKELLEFEAKTKNFYDFTANFNQYQSNLEKISRLFIDISEPVEFIEFLEKEAAASRLSIDIAPPAPVLGQKDGNARPFLEFNLNIKGAFPDFLRFLDRLESGPYLVEPDSVSVRRMSDIKNSEGISAALSIKAYAK